MTSFDFEVISDIPCGPDVAAQVEAVRPFVDAGFSHVALAQIGGEAQPAFLEFAREQLLPALRGARRAEGHPHPGPPVALLHTPQGCHTR